MDYIYDGSFEGLLSSIYEAFYSKEAPKSICINKNHQGNIFSNEVLVQTDLDRFEKVYSSIINKISSEALRNVYYLYLSELPHSGLLVYNYLKKGYKLGKAVDLHLADDDILEVQNICKRVSFERHKFLGLLRFHFLKPDVYYAPIRPDFNIATLLAPHFKSRLSDQNWLIHDVKRNIAIVYDKNTHQWFVTDFHADHSELITQDTYYHELWKQFYTSISIKNRENLKLQKQYMPKRYWEFLVEKN